MTTTKKEFTVSFWGSHPDDENDDCWTSEDFADLPEAIEAFQQECDDCSVAFVMIDGPNINQIRQNPSHRPRRQWPVELFGAAFEDAAGRSERAMQAGMAFGCDGYNDEMGW